MSSKGEISWKRRTPDGERFEVYVHLVGKSWRFYIRQRRFEDWQPLENPPLEDWLALLDAVRRRVARRLLRPEDEARVVRNIRERFPETALKGL